MSEWWRNGPEVEVQPDGSKIRGVERIATVPEGHVEAYKRWNAVEGTQFGARLVTDEGRTKVSTEGHPSRTDAGNWMLKALGIGTFTILGIILGVLVSVVIF